jgi:porin
MLKPLLLFFLAVIAVIPAHSQSADIAGDKMFWFQASYRGDVVSNTSGGLETGTWYLGMANLRIAFQTEAAGLWKGGQLFVNGNNTHGAMPSLNYIGDFQRVSNIEAGNHTFLEELWYKHTTRLVEVTAGLQKLNSDYAYTPNGALFLNNSFGIPPTIAGSIPAPVFPLTSLGMSAKWFLTKTSALLTAVFDGSPTDLEENPYNINWEFEDDGFLFFTEYQYALRSSRPGTYRAGVYAHQHIKENADTLSDRDQVYRNNYGLYVIADQVVWKSLLGNRSLSVFGQFGTSPKPLNFNRYYAGLGFRYSGLLDMHGHDAIGLAVAHAVLSNNSFNETTFELTCKIPVIKQVYLQTDIQYIRHPGGTDQPLNNSLVAVLRIGIDLSSDQF